MALACGTSLIRTGPLTLKTKAALRTLKYLTKVRETSLESLNVINILL